MTLTSSVAPPMTTSPTDLRGALAAIVGGDDVPRHVRDDIGASWIRSVLAGLKPDRVEVPFDPDLDGDGVLVRAARPVLDRLADDLHGARVGVALSNAHGHVLSRRVSDTRLTARLDRLLLAPGFIHAEDVVGTNGIGTAIAARKPVAVDGAEHFADAMTTVACAGAPIFDPPSRRLLGAIDLTTGVRDATPLMLPFATRAALEIEQRLVDESGISHRLMLQRFLLERRRAKGPIVLIDDHTMITNASAARLVNADDEPMLRHLAMDRAAGKPPGQRLELSGGTTVNIRAEPILDGRTRVGEILWLEPIPEGAAESRSTLGWGSLTETERSVVALVADGLTNREAAERLFMSRHTVGSHLRSIFRKLDIRTRVDLTRVATARA